MLDLNCEVEYQEAFLSEKESETLYRQLCALKMLTEPFQIVLPNGKWYKANYGKCMFMDSDLYAENRLPSEIWGSTQLWFENLENLRHRIAKVTGHHFQVCVGIYYPDGNSGVDYHSDLVAFGDTNHIASISLGEERVFCLREKATQIVHELVLKRGSLLFMGKHCQERYEHALPIVAGCKKPRINLTFRKFGFDS